MLMGSMFISCKKSNNSLLKEYESICEQLKEATKENDVAEKTRLSKKCIELENELDKRDLSDQEQIDYSLLRVDTFLNTTDVNY